MTVSHSPPRASLADAIRAADLAGVRALLASGVAPTAEPAEGGASAVLLALYYGQEQIARLLLDAGAPLDVFAAAALGDTARLGALLDQDPALRDARSPDGWTPLHLAAHFGRQETATLLLARGADPCCRSHNLMRNTPLHAALAGRQPALAALLLARGAEADARQRGGWTALHQAAHLGDAALVALLLGCGADPRAASDDGRTPAALAEAAGHARAAELLRRSVPRTEPSRSEAARARRL